MHDIKFIELTPSERASRLKVCFPVTDLVIWKMPGGSAMVQTSHTVSVKVEETYEEVMGLLGLARSIPQPIRPTERRPMTQPKDSES